MKQMRLQVMTKVLMVIGGHDLLKRGVQFFCCCDELVLFENGPDKYNPYKCEGHKNGDEGGDDRDDGKYKG